MTKEDYNKSRFVVYLNPNVKLEIIKYIEKVEDNMSLSEFGAMAIKHYLSYIKKSGTLSSQ